MKQIKIFTLLAGIFLGFQAFAGTQSVSCSGTGRSGKSYEISFEADEKNAVYSSKSGIKRFAEIPVRLREIGKSGRVISDQREIVKDFMFMPSETKPTIHQFIASGDQRIFIVARPETGLLGATMQIDVGRFRGIVLDQADCKVTGKFTEVKDTVDEIAKKYGLPLESQSAKKGSQRAEPSSPEATN